MATTFSSRFGVMLVSTTATAIGCAAFLAAWCLRAADADSFAERTRQAFQTAETEARRQPTNDAVFVVLARAAFDWAEFARQDGDRAAIAQVGIDAARKVIARSPTNAAAHYWLGMDIGQLARTRSLGALKLVREIADEFERARVLDEHVDFAGPDRSSGLLYRDAPGWPASIGSKKRAREHLERAVKLHPEFPDNQLALIESYEEWGERQNFARQMAIAEKVFADARQKFTGREWDVSWRDWNQRWSALRTKAGEVGKTTPSKGTR